MNILNKTTEEILESRGINPTQQRIAITEYLLNTDIHPTADQIREAVCGDLCRATVYNTLNLLVEKGVINEIIGAPGNSTRYDAKTDEHHHFIDRITGRIYDIDEDQLKGLSFNLDRKYKVDNFHVTVYGVIDDDIKDS